MKKRSFFLLVFSVLLSSPLYAYLDPGSGSVLIYAVIGIGVTLLYSLKGLFYKAVHYLGGRKVGSGFAEADVVLHSEGKQYDHLFLPLLRELASKKIDTAYITQYQREEDDAPLPETVTFHEVEAGAFGFAALNQVKAKVLVTTTPQLDVMMFKRSKRVKHYSHLLHSPVDIGIYKPFAFDFFDSILCPGSFMFDSFRTIEKKRGTKEKKLYDTGIVYYDEMVKNIDKTKTDGKTVLISPSWGKNGLFTVYGTDFLKTMTSDYSVIVRPHPQIAISQPEIFAELEQTCSEMGFEIDTSPDNRKSLERASVMISDFSGIIYDFSYLYERPVIVMDTELDFEAFEGRVLKEPLWQQSVRDEIGRVITKDNIGELDTFIREEMFRKPENIIEVRKKYLSNFGNAASVAAAQIEEILQETESRCALA